MRTALAGPFPPYRGGIAQFSMRLLETLRNRFPGDVFDAVSYRRLYPGILFPGTSQRSVPDPAVSGERAAEELLDSLLPWRWLRARSLLEGRGIDRLVVQWWHPFFAPCLAMSLPRGARSAAVCHNVLPHEGFPLRRTLTSALLRRMDLLVVHSASDAEEAAVIAGHHRVLRLFHPVYDQYLRHSGGREAARAALGFGPDDRVVLFFGLVRPYKGLEDLVAALGLLPDDVSLLVAGESYMDTGVLRRRIDSAGLSGRVHWHDRFVPDREVADFFDAADAVALPYRTATQSGVAQIALSFRKPLVLTDTGGLRELVDDGSTGRLVPVSDPEALAGAILSCLDLSRDAGTAERIGRKALEFTWPRYAETLMEALS